MQDTIDKTTRMVHQLDAVNRILQEHNYDDAKLIPILQEIQAEYKFLSRDVISYVASSLKIPTARVYGVATFYAHFSLQPKGKHIFRLCDGTACHVKKSHSLLNALRERLGLADDQTTSKDMMFTIETVSCLGACGLAPVMLVDDEVHGQCTPERAVSIIEQIMTLEASQ